MSNFILQVNPEILVDHKNRDSLDNQRRNLRVCTRSQNMCNRNMFKNSQTRYKGVHLRSDTGKYRAYIQINGSMIHLGQYTNPVEAARAYNKAAKKYHGEFACLNKIGETV